MLMDSFIFDDIGQCGKYYIELAVPGLKGPNSSTILAGLYASDIYPETRLA